MIGRFVGPFSHHLVSHYMVDSQNDLLMSLMSKTQKAGISLEGLAVRLLVVNFSAIHATSMVSDAIWSPPVMQF